jgi:L,D-transpeptidase catalytic domain/Putative peptidoglycan binding domain
VVARVWIRAAAAAALLAAGVVVAALLAWPRGAVGASRSGLAAVSLPGFAGEVGSLQVTDPAGNSLQVVLRHGTILPLVRVPPGERLTVTVSFRRPSWIGWLVGHSAEHTFTVVTPVAHLDSTLLRPKRGSAVTVRFDAPVSRVAVGGGKRRLLGAGQSVVSLGVTASGSASTGTTTVAAAARPWEKLQSPVRVSWFVAGPRAQVVAAPADARLAPGEALTLTFSQPVSDVLGSRRPQVVPATPGSWRLVDAHTLSFQPSGLGFGLGGTIHVRLPRHTFVTVGGHPLTWQVPAGSTLRLQEILARLHYLPLRWRGDGSRPTTVAAELAAAVSPPTGHFSWRYPKTPAPLRALWKEGEPNDVTRAAVMRFEDVHGLATDGVAGPRVWRALLQDDLAGRSYQAGYSYVLVHETLPQSLNLWHNGKFILASPGNTGIAQAPTAQGTWPVFEHIPVGTMSGTNPDGSHYNDPGIQWISYFHGGDAIHAFPRPSYGTPQSLGCVELPLDAAAKVWPYTPIGTLVTVES